MKYGSHRRHGGAAVWLASAALALSLGLCPQVARAEEADVPEEEAICSEAVDTPEVKDEPAVVTEEAPSADDANVPSNRPSTVVEEEGQTGEPDQTSPEATTPADVPSNAIGDQTDTAADELDQPDHFDEENHALDNLDETDPTDGEDTTPSNDAAIPAVEEAPTSSEEGVQAEPVAGKDDHDPLKAAAETQGWVEEDGERHYYDEDGSLHTGWLACDEGIFFFENDGTMLKGLYYIDHDGGSDLYHFDESTGALMSGWVKYGSSRLHFDAKTGKADKGWKTISGKRYHFNSNYAADMGVVKIGSKRYAFGSDGALLTGKTGLRTLGSKKYYVKSDGSIFTGFKTIKGKRYVFTAANGGAMLKSCLYKKYLVAWDGACHKIPAKKGSKKASAKRVAKLIAKCITPKSKIKSMKDLTRVREAAGFVAAFANRAKYTMKGRDYRTPYGVFYAKRYSCAGTTRALGAVLSRLKIKWKHVNANKRTHQWCKVKMDGKWGWADSDIEFVDIDWETGKMRGSTVTGDANYGKRF